VNCEDVTFYSFGHLNYLNCFTHTVIYVSPPTHQPWVSFHLIKFPEMQHIIYVVHNYLHKQGSSVYIVSHFVRTNVVN